MNGSEVRYARTGGVSTAYQVVGGGGPDLVFVPGFASHLDLAWEEPHFARFLRGLGSFARVVWFDKRGTGLSDPARSPQTLDDALDDVASVCRAACPGEVVLFGVAVGAAICTSFALRHPDRVRSLVLWGGHARLLRDTGYPAGWSREFFDAVVAGVDEHWATGHGIEAMNPSLAGDERFRNWFARHARAAASPAQARELFVNPAGTVTVVPDDAIHTVEALDGRPAVSLHVYGTDINTARRSTYHADGTRTEFRPEFTWSRSARWPGCG